MAWERSFPGALWGGRRPFLLATGNYKTQSAQRRRRRCWGNDGAEKSYFRWGTILRGGTSGLLLKADILTPPVLFCMRGLSGPEWREQEGPREAAVVAAKRRLWTSATPPGVRRSRVSLPLLGLLPPESDGGGGAEGAASGKCSPSGPSPPSSHRTIKPRAAAAHVSATQARGSRMDWRCWVGPCVWQTAWWRKGDGDWWRGR